MTTVRLMRRLMVMMISEACLVYSPAFQWGMAVLLRSSSSQAALPCRFTKMPNTEASSLSSIRV